MLDALAAAASKRPWAFLAAVLALLGALLLLASGARDHLGHPAGDSPRPDVVVVTSAGTALSPQVYEVALGAIEAGIEAKPEVSEAAVSRPPSDEGVAVLRVELAGAGATERRRLADGLADEIDPGPLQVRVGGRVAQLLEAEESVLDDLWRLELLALPLAALVLVAGLGLRLVAGPPLCAAIALAGAVAGLALAGRAVDLSLLAVVPAAAVALALAVELSVLLAARWHDEIRLGDPLDALRSALADGVRTACFAAVAVIVVALAATVLQLRDALDPGVAAALGVGVAAAFAALASMLVMPALFTLAGRRQRADGTELGGDGRLAGALAAAPRALARGGGRCLGGVVIALALALALGYPALGAETLPLTEPQAAADELVAELPLAAALAAVLLAVTFAARAGTLRAAPFALSALVAPLAALGIVTGVFQDGAGLFGLAIEETRIPTTGAVAAGLLALCAISAARTAAALDMVRIERELDPGAPGVAERAGQLTLPAAAVATVLAGSAFAVLVGAGLEAAQELGAMFAAGLLVDLLVVRAPVLAALARWGAAPPARERSRWRSRIRWRPRWRRHQERAQTASPS